MPYILGYQNSQFSQLLFYLEHIKSIQGVIFFKRNLSSLDQFEKHALMLKEKKEDLKFTIDYEGGKVNRVHQLSMRTEPAQVIGWHFDSSSKSEKSAIYRLSSQTLKVARLYHKLGIDVVFGPCIDRTGVSPVIENYQRSYSLKSSTLQTLAEVFIESFAQYNIKCVLKHFPTHSHALGDTHYECGYDYRTLDDLEEDLMLYRNILDKYPTCSLMLSHCVFPQICSRPVSFSKTFHQKILSYCLSSSQIKISEIYTDCLDMFAVKNMLRTLLLPDHISIQTDQSTKTDQLIDEKLNLCQIFSTLEGFKEHLRRFLPHQSDLLCAKSC